jgi:hypothetical protein
MVEAGRLTGRDAEPLRPVPMIRAVAAAATAAEAGGDRETIAMWYNFGPHLLLDDDEATGANTLDDVRSIDAVRELREIVERMDALSVKLAYDYQPADDVIAANPVDTWWWHEIASGPVPGPRSP